MQKARRENQKKREADEKQKKAKEARERAASIEIIYTYMYRIDFLLQEKSKRRTKSIRKAQLVDIHAEGDQEGVLDGLLEALKTGSAFAK